MWQSLSILLINKTIDSFVLEILLSLLLKLYICNMHNIISLLDNNYGRKKLHNNVIIYIYIYIYIYI